MSIAPSQLIQRWSTSDIPQIERLDFFASALSEAVHPLSIDAAQADGFDAEIAFAAMGEVGICRTNASAHTAHRRREELARSDGRAFNLLMSLQSSWTAEHRGQWNLMPRDILIMDSEIPLTTVVRNSFTAINFNFSEAWLRRWIPNPNALVTQHIAGDSRWGAALSAYLRELSPELVAAPPLPLTVMADQIGCLFALTFNAMQQAKPVCSAATRSLQERIHDCILQRCTEPELTAADVAASTSVSVRTLHRTLSAANETFGARLVHARAVVAIRMLTSPLFKRVTSAEIGTRAGFLSSSHFIRVIRKHTSQTPRQLRRGINLGGADTEFNESSPDS